MPRRQDRSRTAPQVRQEPIERARIDASGIDALSLTLRDARSLLTHAPSHVDDKQLRELHIRLRNPQPVA